jgi:membrane fusion protein (multidrug efflux system)
MPWEERMIRSRKALPCLLFLCLATMMTGCGGSSGGSSLPDAGGEGDGEEKDVIVVRTTPVARRTISDLYSTSATLRADREASVTARTRGVVRELLVEEGDTVGAGQVLAVLEDDEQKIEFQGRNATRDAHVREYERAGRLHEDGMLSDEAFESARRLAEESEQAAALAELHLSRTRIRAPFAGKILRRHLDAGATVTEGSQVFDIADLDPLYADVNIPERHVARLVAGQRVHLTADADGKAAEAAIERIAPLVDSDTGTVKVTLAVDRRTRMRPGAFVRVGIVTDTHENAAVVPRSALVAEGRRWHLFVLQTGGEKVRRLEVEPGFEERDEVEILQVAGGEPVPSEGSEVVVVGASALSDGSRVRVMNEEEDGGEGRRGAS